MRGFYLVFYFLIRFFFFICYRIKPINASVIGDGPALICPNHSAYSDILFLSFAAGYKRHLRYVAKKDLLKIPLFGFLIRKAGTISIDRGNSDINAIREIIAALKSGHNVVLFPEGTRIAESGSGDAKTGAAMIALRAGVPVIPAYIPRKKRFFSRVPVVFGEPYRMERTKGGYSELASELMEKIESLERQIS